MAKIKVIIQRMIVIVKSSDILIPFRLINGKKIKRRNKKLLRTGSIWPMCGLYRKIWFLLLV